MKDILGYVEHELSLLGEYFRRFAEHYPGVAGNLGLSNDSAGDPDIRILTQAAALLNARIAKKLDDDLPDITASFLEMSAPHLLRPFPSCSIARSGEQKGLSGTTHMATVPRGAVRKSPACTRDGTIIKFRTGYPVTLAPAWVSDARFIPMMMPPPGTGIASGATSEIALTIEWTRGAMHPDAPGPGRGYTWLD